MQFNIVAPDAPNKGQKVLMENRFYYIIRAHFLDVIRCKSCNLVGFNHDGEFM